MSINVDTNEDSLYADVVTEDNMRYWVPGLDFPERYCGPGQTPRQYLDVNVGGFVHACSLVSDSTPSEDAVFAKIAERRAAREAQQRAAAPSPSH